MTISFSGLASGLDTSSWVESLVSLKQAKVTELEDEKDLVTTTKEAVANIKSFFTSFRSVLEKVTDTKFNVSTMDIFAQNLATSSNVDILSAIATAEAKEATYEINVDKLATSTQAASGYKFTTQIVTTTAATLDSKLANLGVKSGNIGVTVNGLEQNLYIADNDTIQTFIDKLNNLGVSASFNQDSGVFNMNIGINDINDKDNTGIIAALHLEGVNEGYQSDKLEITKTDTTFESADESTLLTDLGVKRGTLTIEANDAVYNVEIDNDTTLGEFLQALRDENINASLTDDGVFRLEDAVITNDGTTNLIDAFGLQQSVSSNIQQSGDLSYKTVVTDVTVATLDSLLNDITENGVSNGDTVVVKNSNNETSTIRLSSTSTLGDLFDGLKAAGMMAVLNNDGTITISGGEITGGSFDAIGEFGLVTTPTSSTVTGNVLQKTVTTTQLATEDTRLVKDLGVKAGALEVTTGDGTVHSITIDSGMTIGDLIDTYESLGISASIDTSGVLTVAGGSFSEVSGGTDLLTKLYGTDMVDNTNQNSAYSKTDALKYDIMVTETVEATLDSLINDVTQNGVSDGDTLIVRNSNNQTYTINLNSSSTLADMFSGLQNAGLRGTLNENGSITISGGEIIGGSFDAVGEFNLSSVTNSGMVSGSVLKETITTVNTATLDTRLVEDLGVKAGALKVETGDGTTHNVTITSGMTIGDLIDEYQNIGISASIDSSGVLTVNGGIFSTVSGGTDLLTKLYGTDMVDNTNQNSAYSKTDALKYDVMVTRTVEATLASLINDVTKNGVSNGDTLIVRNSNNQTHTINLNANSTLADMFTGLQNAGLRATLNENGSITISGGEIIGGSFDAVGEFNLSSVTNSGMVSGSVLKETITTVNTATSGTRLVEDLGVKAGALKVETSDGTTHNVMITSGMTIGDLIDEYRDIGISASIDSSGVLTVNGGIFSTVSGGTDLLTKLYGTDMVDNTNQNSAYSKTDALKYDVLVTKTVSATLDSLINDVAAIKVSNGATLEVRNANNQTYTINLNSSSTLADMFTGLQNAGLRGTLNENGSITISGGEITGGSFDAVRAFNLSSVTNSGIVTGDSLQETITNINIATEDTRLVEDLGVKAGALKVETSDGTTHNVTITSGMTIGDLIDAYDALGISASINSSGVLTVAGGSFSAVSGGTDLLTKLYGTDMVDNTTQNSAYSKSEALKYEITETVKATLDTKLGSMGLESDSAVSFSVKDVGTVSITLSSSMTIQDMIDKLSSKGVSASFDSESAKLTISNAELLLNAQPTPVYAIFGFTSIITGRYTSSKAVYGVQQEEVYANENTTLGQLGLSGSSTLKHQVKLSVDGVVYNTYVTSATKMSQVIEWINSNGATATLTNGIFRIEGGAIIEGPLEVLLGLSTQTTIVQSTTEQTAGLSTTLAAVANTNDFKITFKDSATGAASTVYTFASDATFADLVSVFADNDIDVTLTDGVLSFDTSAGTYAEGALLDDFGVKSSTGIVGLAQSSINLQEIWTLTTNASSYTTFEELGIDPTNMTICIEGNLNQCTINTLTENSTLANFFNRLSSWGVGLTGSISNGVITIKSTLGNGNKLTGTLAEALGINWGSTTKWNSTSNVTYKKVVYSSVGGNGSLEMNKPGNNNTGSTSSGLGSSVSTGGGTGGVTFQGTTVTCTATLDTTLSELGITSDQVITYSKAPSGGVTYQPARITIKSTDTLRTLKSKIASYASMTISSTGRVSIVENSSDGNLTLTSSIISALKLAETETYDTTASVTLSPITTTSTVGAKLTTQLRAIKATALDLNPTYSITIGNVETGSLTTYTFASTDTIDDFVTTLQEAGVDATFDASTATVKIAAGGDGYITSMSKQIGYIFLFRTGEGDSYEYSDDGMSASGTLKESSNNSTTVPTSQSSVRPLMVTIEVQSTVTTDTKLSDLEDFNGTNLGITSGQVYVYTNGVRNTLNISSTETIGSLSSKLAAYGISVDMSNNQLYFNGNSNSYLTTTGLPVASASNILTKLGIQTWNTNYDTVSGSLVAESSSNGTANGDVKLVDLRGSNGNLLGITTGTYYIYDNGTKITATITSDMTVTDFLNTLNAHGISAGISSDGSITLSGKNNSYIASSGGSNIVDTLFPDWEYVNTYTSEDLKFQTEEEKAITSSTKLSDINGVSYKAGLITVNRDGIKTNITLTTDETIGSLIDKLNLQGFNAALDVNGSLTIRSDGNLLLEEYTGTETASNVMEILGIDPSNWIKTSIYDSASLDREEVTQEETAIVGETKLSEIGVTAGTYYIYENGVRLTATITSDMTVSDFLNTMNSHGISASISSDGSITLSGKNNSYIASSGGSNIVDTLFPDWQYVNTYTSEDLKFQTEEEKAITSSTKLSDINGVSYKAGLITVNRDGIKTNITLTTDETIGSLIDKLNLQGFNAALDVNGSLTIRSDGNLLLEEYTGTETASNVLEILGIDPSNWIKTSIYDSASLDREEVTQEETAIVGETKLSEIGVTAGTYYIYENGVRLTATITSDMTVSDFLNTMNSHGISASISSDGSITLSGKNNSYIASSGGSNIVDTLFPDWQYVNTYTSEDLKFQTEEEKAISSSTKLSDINGVSYKAGLITVNRDGIKTNITLTTDETIGSLIDKLNLQGFNAALDVNGSLTIRSDGNLLLEEYVGTQTASNVMEILGIDPSNWIKTSIYDSASLDREEVTQEETAIVGETKLSEIGVTAGTYYIYENGVRLTATITSDMTVSDFLNTMNSHGISASISSDGSITLSGKNNSYIASSGGSNIVDTLFPDWQYVNTYTSEDLKFQTEEVMAVTTDTKLADINGVNYVDGLITINKNGAKTNITLTSDETIGSFINKLNVQGFNAALDINGSLIIGADGNLSLESYAGTGKASNALNILGLDSANWIKTNTYDSKDLNKEEVYTIDTAVTRDTMLSDLGIKAGEYYIYSNGVKYTAMISGDDTIGSFIQTLQTFGIQASLNISNDKSTLTILGNGDSYVAKSNSVANASNVVDRLFPNGMGTTYDYNASLTQTITTTSTHLINKDTLLSELDKDWGSSKLKSEGRLVFNINGIAKAIDIESDETIGSLIDKLETIGITASVSDGVFTIQSGFDEISINQPASSSNLITNLELTFHDDLGGYAASSDTVMQTVTTYEERTLSVSNYADNSTKLNMMNISSGTFTIYKDGQKAVIQVDSEETFGEFRSRVASALNGVDVKFENGILTFLATDGGDLQIGSTTDSSNLAAVAGLAKNEDGTITSARELYKVNGSSVITDSGLFRLGNVTEGTFTLGNEVFTIDDKTTINDLIGQINSSEESNATAYWDSIDGKLVITSRATGASLINIEAGTSNFTDIMGFTSTETAADGSTIKRLSVDNQTLGANASFTINGTRYTSTSNTVTSDISRIEGVTINLKDITEEGPVTLKIERDKEAVADAIEDVVEAYNELMSNVNDAISIEGELHGETMLKLIRTQLRNLMTSSLAGSGTYKNLDAIGITSEAASGTNVDTENVDTLYFDREKFLEAYGEHPEELKEFLVGTDDNPGVLSKVETLIESTLASVTGYFDSTDSSYADQIQRIDDRISRQTRAVERYRIRLEAKFQSMDLLIANMQNQYSSFLTLGSNALTG